MRDHRSLSAWQKANEVTRWVIGASQHGFRPAVRVPFYQLQTTSLATQLHIARGHALRKTHLFRKHLVLAYAAAIETDELLRLMEATHLVHSDEVVSVLQATDQLKTILLGLIREYRHYR
jgi:four helix bundle protein